MVQDTDNSIKKIMRSTNGGTSWADVGDPTPLWFDQECITGSNDFTRGQAWYDLIAAVDPNDRDVVYIGGVDLLRTTDGGNNWTQLTNWAGNCDFPEVHADQHAIIYQAGSSDVMYFGNDGGIYATSDGSSTNPTFKRKEFNYITSQFYSVAMHPDAFSPEFIGGTQDNGSNKVSSLGISTIVESTGGDGGFAHIDQDNPNIWLTAFTNANISRSTDGGLTFSTLLNDGNGSFINPSDLDDAGNALYAGYSSGRYLFISNLTGTISSGSVDAASLFGTVTSTGNTATITSVSASQNTSGRIFLGLNNGHIVFINNANSAPSGGDITGGAFPVDASVSCIAVEEGDDNHLLATFSNYGVASVWESTDGGTNWTDVEGDLPDMPVRWALFNPNNSDEVLLATELGVWSTDNLDGALTEWEPSNDGLANIRTDMLQIRNSDNLVVAATHGRGLFTSDIFTSPNADFTADRNAIYAESTVNFTDASYKATNWEWDFGDGGTSTEENPSHIYKRSGKYEVSLTINSGAFTATKTDFIHVLPNLPTPFSAADGGDFESNPDYFGSDDLTGGINLWERGSPGNAITTLNSGTNAWKTDLDADIIRSDYSSALYSPNFNMTSSGTYTLRFRKSMEVAFANAPMAIQVQYSTDNGNNWTRLGIDNDPDGINWYERGPASAFSIETDVAHDRYGFSNLYTNENTEYDVSFLAGNSTVAFRFVHFVNGGYSAAGYQVDGFMIDDFEIAGTVNEANVNITENSPGSALSFDGTDDYVTLSDLSINESFTTEMWISPNSDTDGQTFIAKHNASGVDIFKLGYNSGAIEVTVRGTTVIGGSKTTGLQHLAVSVEKLTATTSEITVYRDGQQLFQNTVNDVIGDPSGLDWVLGQDWDGISTTSDFFDGDIDELRIWNSVRTQEEIRLNNFLIVDGLDSDLIGYWQFNEAAGSNVNDVITSNTGNLQGASWITSNVSVAKGASNLTTIIADGTTSSGNLQFDFSGVTGSFDIVTFELSGSPSGTSPSDEYILTSLVDNPYTIINQYGAGTFSVTDLTYTYGAGVFTETDPSKIFLFKRPSTSSGSWGTAIAANSINTATGEVIFNGISSFSQTVTGVGDGALPVELVSFSGKRINDYTKLSWETASELNNDRFEILRSLDGENWTVIGNVNSKVKSGNSQVRLEYEFKDKNEVNSPTAFYQLKQVDFDGKYSMSKQILVSIDVISGALNLYPNPASDYLYFDLNSIKEQSVVLKVIDVNGKIYLSENKKLLKNGGNTVELNVSELKQGIYILILNANGKQQTRRFLIKK